MTCPKEKEALKMMKRIKKGEPKILDPKLEELYTQRHLIDSQILIRIIEAAKEKGEVVDSIDKLVCDKHPGAAFEVIGEIPDSWTSTKKKGKKSRLEIYQCVSCGKYKSIKELTPKEVSKLKGKDITDIFNKSKAYECSVCGIVKGEVKRVGYSSPREAWRNMAGREGDHYHCRICNTQLGSRYWKFS